MKEHSERKLASIDDILNDLDPVWKKYNDTWGGYSYKSLNKYGDLLVNQPVLSNVEKSIPRYLKGYTHVSKGFLEKYNKINKLVKEHNSKLILTYPCTIRKGITNLSIPKNRKLIEQLKADLKEHSIDIWFNPSLFNYDVKFFYNTIYHLNAMGANIRSEILGNRLAEVLNNKNIEPMDYEMAIDIVRKLEDNPDSSRTKNLHHNYIKEHNENIRLSSIMLEDLGAIQMALDKYYSDHGSYPKSAGFDGLYAKWGRSGMNWIKELSPNYIEKLPRDPRELQNPIKQYYYKSDGVSYKLIAHGTNKLISLQLIDKNLIDPQRPTWAFGFWTSEARNW